MINEPYNVHCVFDGHGPYGHLIAGHVQVGFGKFSVTSPSKFRHLLPQRGAIERRARSLRSAPSHGRWGSEVAGDSQGRHPRVQYRDSGVKNRDFRIDLN